MKQSTVIFGTILTAFVIYITLRGQLNDYLGLFSGSGASTVVPSTGEAPDKPDTNNTYDLNNILSNLGLN
jgi:hypothetical protein